MRGKRNMKTLPTIAAAAALRVTASPACTGGITCTSSEKGLECRNGDGHGFFLSKGKQELF
jgi:hypothetical protein